MNDIDKIRKEYSEEGLRFLGVCECKKELGDFPKSGDVMFSVGGMYDYYEDCDYHLDQGIFVWVVYNYNGSDTEQGYRLKVGSVGNSFYDSFDDYFYGVRELRKRKLDRLSESSLI